MISDGLRSSVGSILRDVRYRETAEGFDFLLVHPPNRRREALRLFVIALQRSTDIPPFDIDTVVEGSLEMHWYDGYTSVLEGV